MSTMRGWTVMAAAMLLAPTALGAEPFAARSLLFAGATTIDTDASALFYIMEEGALVDWALTSDGGSLYREYLVELVADNPLNPDAYLYNKETSRGEETIELGALAMSSRGGMLGGALLATGRADASATSSGLVRVRSVSDALVSQFGPSDMQTSDEAYPGIEASLPGEQLELEISDGTMTLRGDLVVELFGPHYVMETDEGVTEHATGESETQRTGAVAEVKIEYHRLTLTNAVLQLRAQQPVQLFAGHPTIDVTGTLEVVGAEGEFGGGMSETGDAVYAGATRLTLSPASGLVAASSPDATLATGAVIAQPKIPLLFAAGLALLALGALGVILHTRRQRGDDLELALLAMEERRWTDALPRLARVAKRDPMNAGVQVDRALCLEQIGRLEEAARAFETALRAAPKHAEAHFYYARTLAKMHETEAARVHLEAALERDPRLVEMMRAEAMLKGL